MSTSSIGKLPSGDGSQPPTTKEAKAFDKFVGARIRQRRKLLGMSQQKLAELVGVTFQQVQKYESAQNRIGPERLLVMARVLGVPLTFLLDDQAFYRHQQGVLDQDVENFANSKEGAQIARAFSKIEDRELRQAVITLVSSLSRKNMEIAVEN